MMQPLPRFGWYQVLGLTGFLCLATLLAVLGYLLTPPGGARTGFSSLRLLRRPPPLEANLVLITIDGLRLDRVGIYGAQQNSPTRHIDDLARHGFRFEQAVTPSPVTLAAHAALMTGLDPSSAGVLSPLAAVLPEERTTLAEELRGAGFRTAAFVGSGALGRWSGMAQGFENFDAPGHSDGPLITRTFTDRPASEVIDAARPWIDENFRSRFFLWVQLTDPLRPQPPPASFRRLHADAYDAVVASTDAQLGRLLDRLASLGVMDHTIVVITASHGLGLGDHGEQGSGAYLYDTTIRIPLLLRVPEAVAANRSIPEQVRLLDLSPTLFDLLQVDGDAGSGTSLVPLLDPGGRLAPLAASSETAFQEVYLHGPRLRSLRLRGWKLIDGPIPELYDLRSDPGESFNIAPDYPSRVQEMQAALDATGGPGSGRGMRPEAREVRLLEEGIAALRAGGGARATGTLDDLVQLLRVGRPAGPGEPPISRATPAVLALLGASMQIEGLHGQAMAIYEEAVRGPKEGHDAVATPILVAMLYAEIDSCRDAVEAVAGHGR